MNRRSPSEKEMDGLVKKFESEIIAKELPGCRGRDYVIACRIIEAFFHGRRVLRIHVRQYYDHIPKSWGGWKSRNKQMGNIVRKLKYIFPEYSRREQKSP